MNDEQRINAATEKKRQGEAHLIKAMEHPDPVWVRRHLARAAGRFREAAALLDDNGWLSPDWDV